MSITTQLQRIMQAKEDIKASIENKGCTVPSSALIDSYAAIIDTIQTFDPTNGHDYVEIGGLKWATMNVGATAVTDTGLYFQWGDTTGYKSSQVGSSGTTNAKPFAFQDYKFGNGNAQNVSALTKYNSSDGKTVLGLEDDGVRANWGGKWRMPTTEEFAALGTATTSAWTADYEGSGVSGLVLTSKTNGATLFFSAAGYANGGSMYNVGSHGYYWSSSLYSGKFVNGYNMYFSSSAVNWQRNYSRHYGFPLRGVLGE